jgi:hypothetical protein
MEYKCTLTVVFDNNATVAQINALQQLTQQAVQGVLGHSEEYNYRSASIDHAIDFYCTPKS